MPHGNEISSFAQSGIVNPPAHAVSITPNDSTDLTQTIRAIYIGDVSGGTDLKVTTAGGETVTYTGLTVGSTKVLRITRVWATGTTVASLIGEY